MVPGGLNAWEKFEAPLGGSRGAGFGDEGIGGGFQCGRAAADNE